METAFAQACASQLPAIREALAQAGLPWADLTPPHLENFIVAAAPTGAITHCAGLEVFAADALLRSVLVTAALQGKGDGGRLLAAIGQRARARGVGMLYLLTTTATAFFAVHGFQVVDRAEVPAALRQTREFTTLCPATAVCMVKALVPSEGASAPIEHPRRRRLA